MALNDAPSLADPLRYTPYGGRKKPFAIGLEPLDPKTWIEPDADLEHYLSEKDRLFESRKDDVFRARADTIDAQREALGFLTDHLTAEHSNVYRRTETGSIRILQTDRVVDPMDPVRPPLETAARLVQDDLVLMRRENEAYVLAAAAVCFPSSWSLAEKFGLPLDAIHEPVPGYAGVMAERMRRIFDRLSSDQIVWRTNWSIYDTAALPAFRNSEQFSGLWQDRNFDKAFIRVERQTLRRLPESGDLLFTIRIYLDPMERLQCHPERARLAAGLRTQLLALDADQLSYKALTVHRDSLAKYLEELASR
ncbi:MAG: DUF3445 domain-containing protein [Pseudomonadota bacterium]